MFLKSINWLFKMDKDTKTAKNIFKSKNKDLEHFLEELSPFYPENHIEDVGIIEIILRKKKPRKY